MTDPVVTTGAGRVRGVRAESPAGPIETFLAIPYAEAPTGDRRWRPPAPRAPWSGERNASRPGPAAWQPRSGPLDGLVPGMGATEQGDDCLSVNVWTPGVDDRTRPVLVWIHGGAFSLGAGSLPVYDGARLAARHDVVVVTLNYRLGVFGFLVLDDPSCTPNVGLLDQVAALTWVRDEIGSFGGDPTNVTVFGESAGAGSVLSLLAMPVARGLFQRAIVQSGATELLLDRPSASVVAAAVGRAAGVSSADVMAGASSADVDADVMADVMADVEALRALPPETLVAAQAAAANELLPTVGTMPFHPCVDGDVLPHGWWVPPDPSAPSVPVIIGTTRDEMALFAGFDPSAAALDDAGLARRLGRLGVDPARACEAYAATGQIDPPAVWSAVQTDTAMWVPALRVAEARAAVAPVWMYRFDRPAANPALGACHGVDIPFAFGTVAVDGWGEFLGDPPGAAALASTVATLWASFARHGHPSAHGVDWPTFDLDTRATLILDDEVTLTSDPWEPRRRLWAERPR